MEITVNVPDALAVQARERGIRVEQYVEQLLTEQLAISKTGLPRTPESVRAWLDSLAQFSEKIPPLPETITREWIYNNHD